MVRDCRLRVRVCLQRDHLGGQPLLDSQEAKTVPEKPLFLYNVAQLAPEEQLQPIVMAAVSSTSGCRLGNLHGLSKADISPGAGLPAYGPIARRRAQGQRALGHFEVDI